MYGMPSRPSLEVCSYWKLQTSNRPLTKKQATQLMRQLVAEFITYPSDSAREEWISAQGCYVPHYYLLQVLRGNFFSKLAFYKEREQAGQLLARIVQSHQASLSIGALHTQTGVMLNSPNQILLHFLSFQTKLLSNLCPLFCRGWIYLACRIPINVFWMLL